MVETVASAASTGDWDRTGVVLSRSTRRFEVVVTLVVGVKGRENMHIMQPKSIIPLHSVSLRVYASSACTTQNS